MRSRDEWFLKAAPLGMGVRIITALVAVLLLGVPLMMLGLGEDMVPALLVLGLGLSLGLYLWAAAPSGYAFQGDTLRVRRRGLPALVIPGVRRMQVVPTPVKGIVRTMGAGGVFGYYGRFWSRVLGSFRLYATTPLGWLRLDTDKGTVVISPGPDDLAKARQHRPDWFA